MSPETYNELMNELNFYDSSVGLSPITLNDTETIQDILTEFNYIPVGLYENKNTKGYEFKDNQETYSIQEENGQLKIYKIITI